MGRPNEKPSGRCPACRRRYHLTDTGVLRVHAADRAMRETCPGSGMPPKGGAR